MNDVRITVEFIKEGKAHCTANFNSSNDGVAVSGVMDYRDMELVMAIGDIFKKRKERDTSKSK